MMASYHNSPVIIAGESNLEGWFYNWQQNIDNFEHSIKKVELLKTSGSRAEWIGAQGPYFSLATAAFNTV